MEDEILNSDDYETLLTILDSEGALIYYTIGSPLMEHAVVDKLVKCNCLSLSDRGVISITPDGKQLALEYNKRYETILKSVGVIIGSKSMTINRNVYSIDIPYCNIRYITYRDGVFTFHLRVEQFNSYGVLEDKSLSSYNITPTDILQYLARFIH